MSDFYLFYDIETSGLNKCFDQVLQFAAIRTDLELNELERHKIFIRLNPDVVPSPAAILVHQITLEQVQSGVCEYEAMCEIHRLFNTPGTITVGYNNLGFDDEFLRFSFYRNLLTPYTHQYANNCGRMDIYPMTVMFYLFKPEIVAWPKINDSVTLKLEHLSKHNRLANGNAHDAMNDVEATLGLARLLQRERKMWEYLTGCFNKKTDLARLDKLALIEDRYQQALLVEGGVGAAKFYQSPVIGLGSHKHYKNQSLWLALDSLPFAAITPDNIATTTFVNRKRFGEPPILLPLTEHFGRYLSAERLKLMTENLGWLQKNRELFAKVIAYHQEYKYPEIPNLDIDAALYQIGFMSSLAQLRCDNFHAATVQKKVALIDSFSSAANLRTQALRILGRNYPQDLMIENSLYAEFLSYLAQVKSDDVMVNYKNEIRLTPKIALAEIENLCQSKELSELQSQLLAAMAQYITSKLI